MYEPFELPVMYKGEELMFPAQLVLTGYTHKFQVDVNGQQILFEPDEERRYRAIIEPEKLTRETSPELLKAIAETIEVIVE